MLLSLSSCRIIHTCNGFVMLKGELALRYIAWKDYPPSTFVQYYPIQIETTRSAAEIKAGIVEIAGLIKREDAHHKYDDSIIVVFRPDGKGGRGKELFYRLRDGAYDQYDFLQRYEFMDHAEKQLGGKCIYDYTERMRLYQVPGMKSDKSYDSYFASRLVNVYYFHTETRQKKLICNHEVKDGVYYITDAE